MHWTALRSRGSSPIRPEVPILGGILSVQFGAAIASKIFPAAGPAGVALLRVLFTALILALIARPTLRGRSRRDVTLVIAYGVVLALMNWTFYEALQRLPLGVAVTIEFVGPLAVAVAGSRRWLDAVWVLLAASGIVLLASRGSQAGINAAGVLLALVAAACWASYILLAKRVTAVYPPTHALALGLLFGSLVIAPAGLAGGGTALWRPGVLAACLAVAVLSSLVPYLLELVALRQLSTSVFGLLMSLEPAVAALAGVLVLGQRLSLLICAGLFLVIVASVGTTLTNRRQARLIELAA